MKCTTPVIAYNLVSLAGVQMDEESDDELEEIAGLYAQEGAEGDAAAGTHRYALLRELWASAR